MRSTHVLRMLVCVCKWDSFRHDTPRDFAYMVASLVMSSQLTTDIVCNEGFASTNFFTPVFVIASKHCNWSVSSFWQPLASASKDESDNAEDQEPPMQMERIPAHSEANRITPSSVRPSQPSRRKSWILVQHLRSSAIPRPSTSLHEVSLIFSIS